MKIKENIACFVCFFAYFMPALSTYDSQAIRRIKVANVEVDSPKRYEWIPSIEISYRGLGEDYEYYIAMVVRACELTEGRDPTFFEIGRRWYDISRGLLLSNLWQAIFYTGEETYEIRAIKRKADWIGRLVQLMVFRALDERALISLRSYDEASLNNFVYTAEKMLASDVAIHRMEGDEIYQRLYAEFKDSLPFFNPSRDLAILQKVQDLLDRINRVDPSLFAHINGRLLWSELSRKEKDIFLTLSYGNEEMAIAQLVKYLKKIEQELEQVSRISRDNLITEVVPVKEISVPAWGRYATQNP